MVSLELEASRQVAIGVLTTVLEELTLGKDVYGRYLLVVRPIHAVGSESSGTSDGVGNVHTDTFPDGPVSGFAGTGARVAEHGRCGGHTREGAVGGRHRVCDGKVQAGVGNVRSDQVRETAKGGNSVGTNTTKHQSVSTGFSTKAVSAVDVSGVRANGRADQGVYSTFTNVHAAEPNGDFGSLVRGGSNGKSTVRCFDRSKTVTQIYSGDVQWWRPTSDDFVNGGSRLRSGDGDLPCSDESKSQGFGKDNRSRFGHFENNTTTSVYDAKKKVQAADSVSGTGHGRFGSFVVDDGFRSGYKKRGRSGPSYNQLKRWLVLEKDKVKVLSDRLAYVEEYAMIPVL